VVTSGNQAEEGFFKPYEFFEPGTGPTGAVYVFECTGANCTDYGAWAVTAE
jgi:hypothetical protein